MVLELGWPPTSNTYWRRNGKYYFISDKGKEYRNHVFYIVHGTAPVIKTFLEHVSVRVQAHPPDARKRDLDNLCKSLLDSLQFAKVYIDDYQVAELYIKRCGIIKGRGKLIVSIEELK